MEVEVQWSGWEKKWYSGIAGLYGWSEMSDVRLKHVSCKEGENRSWRSK
jgi:hypothetical protein